MVAVSTAAKVSRTPSPRSATAGIDGTLRAFSVRSMNSMGVTSGRSRLLYWSTSGSEDGIELVRQQVLRHLAEALDVLLPAVGGRVRDEHQRVGALQHQAPRGRVERLPGHRQHLQPQVEPAEAGGLDRQQVEQQRPVLRGVDRHHLAAVLRLDLLVEDLEVRRLPADGRAVVDDLDLDRPLAMVQLDQRDSAPGPRRVGAPSACLVCGLV